MVTSWLFLLLFSSPWPVWGGLPSTFGVLPSLLPRYTPQDTHTFHCLNASKRIPWSAVNDDYCDCPDGSDEPGTSACAQGSFYCENKGHIGGIISSTRVNDGICEPECCDGSDEPAGVCPNRCKEYGKAYREKLEAERKLRKTGAKIRATYIAFAQKEKLRLESLIKTSEQNIATREREVARLKDIAERAETISAAVLEHKKASPLYASLIAHSMALKFLKRQYNKHLEREKALGDILDSLSSNYNPNYQDMAVLEAVRGWQHLSGSMNKEEDGSGDENAFTPEVKEEEVEDGLWTVENLEQDLDALLRSDYVSLLLAHEEHIRSPPSESLFQLSAYIPEPLLTQYESLRATVLSWMETLGIVKGIVDSVGEATQARQESNDAENSLKQAVNEKTKAEEELADLFSVEVFGREGEWKKLEGTCLDLDTGEYIYEVCLFAEARQKPKYGGSSFSLGHFHDWNVTATPGTPEYYSMQTYSGGARCWNGPQRSVNLVLTCGTQNVLSTAVELEKCEYQITGTTPALCLPLDVNESSKDDSEL